MAKLYHEKNRLSGLDDLPDEMKTAVRDSFLRGNIVEPALPEAADPAPKKKKSAKKGTGKDEGNTNVSTTEKAKKRVSNKDTGSDVDTVPQKKAKKGRGVVKKKSAI